MRTKFRRTKTSQRTVCSARYFLPKRLLSISLGTLITLLDKVAALS